MAQILGELTVSTIDKISFGGMNLAEIEDDVYADLNADLQRRRRWDRTLVYIQYGTGTTEPCPHTSDGMWPTD